MNFHSAVSWLDRHAGWVVAVSVTGSAQGRTNSMAVLRDELGRDAGEWLLISPRGGERLGYAVGESGAFLLIEGDFIDAEKFEGDSLLTELHDLHLNVSLI
jgi:hypothetical protein